MYLVTHTFTITMAVFDMAQHVVSGAAGVIGGNTNIDVDAADVYKRQLLHRWKRDYAPKTPDEEWHPLFVEALQKQSHVEYLLDVLLLSLIHISKFFTLLLLLYHTSAKSQGMKQLMAK